MTQAAVSYQIRLLEDRVGAALFVRRPRQVELTAIGQRLAGPVAKALADIGTVFRDLCEENQALLAISCPQTFAIAWLSPRLARFQIENPQFEVRVGTSDHLVDFAVESVDIGLRYGLGEWPGVVADKLFACHFAPLCTPELREQLQLREPRDLLEAPLLSPMEDWWKSWFADVGIDAPKLGGRATLALQMQTMNIQAALRGHGIAMAAPELFADEIATGRLVFAVDHAARDERSYWIVYPQERQRERKIRLFRDWILGEARTACLKLPMRDGSRSAEAPAP